MLTSFKFLKYLNNQRLSLLNRMLQESDMLLKPSGKKAAMICITPTCKDQVLSCNGYQCERCESAHQNCTQVQIKHLIASIIKKKQEITPVIEQAIATLQKLYDDIIQTLSNDKMHVLDQIGLLGLNPSQIQFLRRINQGSISEMKCSEVEKIFQNIHQQNMWQADSYQITAFWKRQKDKFDAIFQQLKGMPIRKNGKFPSKISNSLTCISGFFKGKIVKKVDLLYRASQHNFSCQMFHKICDNKKNVLVLAKTQYGKVIGGYTSHGFKVGNNYIADKKKQAFLFSVTNNKKYQIIQNNKSVFHNTRNFGPTFGAGPDFCIGDKSNQFSRNTFKLGVSYSNGDKQKKNQQILQSFIGTKGNQAQCLVTEWEVYQLQLGHIF